MKAFPFAVIALLAVPVIAKPQQPIPADERPAFEAATIKPAAPGLRIQPGKAPFRLVVIESAQMPTAN